MNPAQNIIAIYAAANAQLLRYVIPTFQYEETLPSFVGPGELSILIPMATYQAMGPAPETQIQVLVTQAANAV